MVTSLCMFGDSVAKGVVFDVARNKYIFIKECFVNLFARNTGIAVENFAKFGCTITKGTEILEKHAAAVSAADYTVLEFGGNDCNFKWNEISDSPHTSHEPETPMADFESRYVSLVEKVRSLGGRPLILNLPPLDAERFFAWISRGNDSDAILQWLGDVQAIFRWHEGYNQTVCALAKRLSVPLIDIRSAFLKSRDYRNLICTDGMHPNAQGHRLISQTVYEFAQSAQGA